LSRIEPESGTAMPYTGNDKPPLIMLVDDSGANLLTGKTALQEGCKVLTAGSAALMLETLEWSKPDLILLDVDMPDMSGFEAIGVLKARPETRDIPVIFLTAMNDSACELQGLELGAVDYIAKPFSPPLLRKRVELHLLLQEQTRVLEDQKRVLEKQKSALQHYNDNLQAMVAEKTQTILKLQNKLLEAMADMIEGRDGVTGDHIANTRRYLRILLAAVIHAGLWAEEASTWDIELLCQSCQLHDIGKIAISDSILQKPGALTAEERATMQQHVAFGIGFIERLEDGDEASSAFLRYAKLFVKYHHEKWDGTGYPDGIAGEEIPLLGRMMAIVDVYDAPTSDRPYKKAFSHEAAVRVIQDGKGKHFDPEMVSLFEQVAGQLRC
jgi:putative two-component system response regulator